MNDKLASWEQAVLWLREQPEQAGLVNACFYDDPLLSAAQRYYMSTEWQALRSLLPDTQGLALDLGAGRGISSYALAKDGWQVCALEPDPSLLIGAGAIRNLAQEANLDIRVEQTPGEALPFADAGFDLVYGRQVLHHAHDLKQLCAEAARVLKPGGLFVATREHVLSKKSDLNSFLASHPLHHLYGGEHAYLLSEYEDAIRASGMELSNVLNPYQSDINLYPETLSSFRSKVGKRLHLPAGLIPFAFLVLLGAMNNTPGRLYSFIARKNG